MDGLATAAKALTQRDGEDGGVAAVTALYEILEKVRRWRLYVFSQGRL